MAELSRRELMVGGASVLALTALGPATRVQASNEELDRALFQSLIGQNVWVVDIVSRTVLSANVSEIVEGPVDPNLDQFTVILRDEAAHALPAGLYKLAVLSYRWRFFDLHLEPAGDDDEGASYYAAPFAQLL